MEDGYKIVQNDYDTGHCFVLKTAWMDSFKEVLINKKITCIRLSESAGWHENNIEFVLSLPFIKGLEIYTTKVKDIRPIKQLTSLTYLAIECPYKAFDFSVLQRVTHLFLRWRDRSEGIFKLSNIIKLNVINYPNEDLSALSGMTCLSSLKLTSSKLVTLEGAESLVELKEIDLFRCPHLNSIDTIKHCHQLVCFEIESCKKVNEIEVLQRNHALKRVVLNNCGEIKSLNPLKHLNYLEDIIFVENTRIMDGDLLFLSQIPTLKNIRFANRKNYSMKREEISQQPI